MAGARILSTVDTEPYGENYVKIKFLGVNLGPLPNFILPQHAYDSSGPSALLEVLLIKIIKIFFSNSTQI